MAGKVSDSAAVRGTSLLLKRIDSLPLIEEATVARHDKSLRWHLLLVALLYNTSLSATGADVLFILSSFILNQVPDPPDDRV